jgi:peptidoglycan-associated lipoprotein
MTSKLADVHFELDKSDLGADSANIVKSDAAILREAFRRFAHATVIIEGFCDDRGSDAHNFELGYKRAEAVRQALVAAQIDDKKLALSSHGKKTTTCEPTDESCRQKNRHVHLTAIQN